MPGGTGRLGTRGTRGAGKDDAEVGCVDLDDAVHGREGDRQRAVDPGRATGQPRPGSAGEGEFVGTNFERKYRREGRPFYAIAAIKP